MPILILNNSAVIKYINKLQQLNKTTLPNLVKATLNAAAMDVKQVTMPKSSLIFDRREINFFKGTSKVEFVKNTHNINEMVSSVGFSEQQIKKLSPQNNYSVKDLEEQEHGGIIGGKTFIPLPSARQGNSNMGLIIPKFRLTEIRKKYFVDAKKFPGRNSKERFTRAAIFVGNGGFVIGTGLDRTFLFQIDSITRFKTGVPISRSQSATIKRGNTVVKATKLYSVQSGRKVDAHGTDFMEKASIATSKKLEKIYIDLAKERIERDLKV